MNPAERADADRPVFALRQGPQPLPAARRVTGPTLTAGRTVQDDLRQVPGVEVVDREGVRDRNLLTSRQPQDLPGFVRACLQALRPSPGHGPRRGGCGPRRLRRARARRCGPAGPS